MLTTCLPCNLKGSRLRLNPNISFPYANDIVTSSVLAIFHLPIIKNDVSLLIRNNVRK